MDRYKKFLHGIDKFLKSIGFSKEGNNYYAQKYLNWELINFQKSKNSNATIKFTINLGICSNSVYNYSRNVVNKCSDIDECHWKKRIGFLLPINADYWWEINEETSIEQLINDIATIISTIAIPEMENYASDESLENIWLNNKSEGLTELERYIYLTTLLKINHRKSLMPIVLELKKFARGRTFEITVEEHLKVLGIHE